MVFSPNFPKYIVIINFGALLDQVIKYTQYFPDQSLTGTLTRSNTFNPIQTGGSKVPAAPKMPSKLRKWKKIQKNNYKYGGW